MPIYTGARDTEYQALKTMRPYIERAAYLAAVAELTRKQAVADRRAEAREKEREKREMAIFQAEMAAAQAKKTAAKAAKREAAAVKREKVRRGAERFMAQFTIPVGSSARDDAVYAISEAATGEFEIVFYVNNRRVRERELNFKGVRRSERHRILEYFYLWFGSEDANSIFRVKKDMVTELKPDDKLQIVLRRVSEPIAPSSLVQHFADGTTHCVAEPLAKYWEERAMTAEAGGALRDTVNKNWQNARACRRYGLAWPGGIPEGERMEEMAKIAKRRIIIFDVMNNEQSVYNAKCPHIFKFMNTREHHLDENHISIDSDATVVTRERMEELVLEHEGQHYLFEGPVGTPTSLRSVKGCWKVENPVHDLFKKHDEANGGRHSAINAAKFPGLNTWLKAAQRICSSPIRVGEGETTGQLDGEYAYTKHNSVPEEYRRGFPARIWSWHTLPLELTEGRERDFVDRHFGLYKFRILSNPDPMLVRMGLEVGGVYILPGPEVLYYIDRGVSVSLLSGVFGSSKDITYSPEMYEKYDTESGKGRAYALWAGCQGHDAPNRAFRFKGTQVWANHLAARFGEANVRIADGIITVSKPSLHYYTNHHTLAFITAYLRINMLECLRTIKQPLVVLMDGVFYGGEKEPERGIFREKAGAVPEKIREEARWFVDCSDVDDSFMPPLEQEALLNHCVLAGAGGCGKTHSILVHKGFNTFTYVVPQHDLGKAKKEDYKIPYTTINKAIGLPYGDKPVRSMAEEGFFPPGFLVDELTMMDGGWIEKLRADHPYAQILVCGDIERRSDGSIMALQCRNGTPGAFSKVFDPPASWGWTFATTDYRSRLADGSPDEELIAFKQQLRAWMREGYTDGGPADAGKLYDLLVDSGRPIVRLKDAVALFKPGDTWIAGKNETSRRLTGLGVVAGWACRAGPEKGSRSITEVAGWEKRGSFTTHSFQGQTVKTGRLFVTINDAFEHAMLYTAISRATSIDQIVLVDR
jgi:hypothetical protein